MTTIKDQLDRLDELYTKTGVDWIMTIHHILTEPTCPTVIINPEGMHAARYRIDSDTIEDGITEAVERVHREVILGQFVEPMAPYTNPDDDTLAKLLAAWKRGEKPNVDPAPRFPEHLTRAAEAMWKVWSAHWPQPTDTEGNVQPNNWRDLEDEAKGLFRTMAREAADELGVIIDD